MDERIRVVSAAIVWRPEGAPPRLLLGQRGPEQAFPLAWCTPGGKVEKGELGRDALERELDEEIGVDASRATFVHLDSFTLDPPTVARPMVLAMYVVEGLSPTCRPQASSEIIGFGWWTVEEIQRLPLTPGDRAALPALVRLLGGKLARDEDERRIAEQAAARATSLTGWTICGDERAVDMALAVMRGESVNVAKSWQRAVQAFADGARYEGQR